MDATSFEVKVSTYMSEEEKPNKPGMTTQFGDILSPGGAMFLIKGWRDIAHVRVEGAKARMRKNGFPITPEVEAKLKEVAELEAQKDEQEYRTRGVPTLFIKLFALNKKSEVEKFSKKIVVAGNQFAQLIHNSEQIGWGHRRQHLQHVPAQLIATESERKAFASNGVGKFITEEAKRFSIKIKGIFEQRKNVNAHLFESEVGWHLFWFTYRDAYGTRQSGTNHWERGDHLHYSSHLWGYEKEKVWESLKMKDYSIKGLHIRYNHELD